MPRISESELILPVLHLLSMEKVITTSTLIKSLRELLQPSGEDLKLLHGRTDDKFSQKVRNLKTHDTLTKDGLVTEVSGYGQAAFIITPKGMKLYESKKDNLKSLFYSLSNKLVLFLEI